jgi:hypothetical protein
MLLRPKKIGPGSAKSVEFILQLSIFLLIGPLNNSPENSHFIVSAFLRWRSVVRVPDWGVCSACNHGAWVLPKFQGVYLLFALFCNFQGFIWVFIYGIVKKICIEKQLLVGFWSHG